MKKQIYENSDLITLALCNHNKFPIIAIAGHFISACFNKVLLTQGSTVKRGNFVHMCFNIKTKLINNLANYKIFKKIGLRNLWIKLAIEFAFS